MTIEELVTMLDEAVTNMDELSHNRGDFDLLEQQITKINRLLEDGTFPKNALGFQTAVFVVSEAIETWNVSW